MRCACADTNLQHSEKTCGGDPQGTASAGPLGLGGDDLQGAGVHGGVQCHGFILPALAHYAYTILLTENLELRHRIRIDLATEPRVIETLSITTDNDGPDSGTRTFLRSLTRICLKIPVCTALCSVTASVRSQAQSSADAPTPPTVNRSAVLQSLATHRSLRLPRPQLWQFSFRSSLPSLHSWIRFPDA